MVLAMRLLDVGVAPGAHGFDAVLRVLEVGGRDDDGVDVLAGVELVVVARQRGLTPVPSFWRRAAAGLAAQRSRCRTRRPISKLSALAVLLERGDQAAAAAVGEADDADADAVVGAEDARVARAGRLAAAASCRQPCRNCRRSGMEDLRREWGHRRSSNELDGLAQATDTAVVRTDASRPRPPTGGPLGVVERTGGCVKSTGSDSALATSLACEALSSSGLTCEWLC